jgi:TPP-dependent pyruvate/acetoin dehydrogenase alpha subunit
MLRIRRFEEKAAELYSLGKIRGFLHLYIGEEAVAVGAMRALMEDDRIVATYRDHGHALARGLPAGALMAEMFGKVNGCSRGRGGSMHFFDVSRRFYGGYAIVAGGLPIAVGLALADAMQGNPVVTACFFGDGAVVEGEFHESMNLAALWRLPVLFLYENNLYAMGTAIERSQAQLDMELRARGYGVPAEAVDGMDVLAVEEATRHGNWEPIEDLERGDLAGCVGSRHDRTHHGAAGNARHPVHPSPKRRETRIGSQRLHRWRSQRSRRDLGVCPL